MKLGSVTLMLAISGSLDSGEEEATDLNKCFYASLIPEEYRKQFANIETVIPTDSIPCDLKRVRDLDYGDG